MITKPSLRATLLAMELGDVEHIPSDMYSGATVRNCASNLGYDLLRKFSVHVDRTARCYTVTRTQ